MPGFKLSDDTLQDFRLFLINSGLARPTIYRTICRIKKFLRTNSSLSYQSAQGWIIDLLEKDTSKATINQYVITFRRWCKFTGEEWAIKLSLYKEEKHIPHTFSNDEIHAFLELKPLPTQNVAIFHQWTLFWSLCAYTGARTGEILSLTVNQVDFGRKCLLFQKTKTGTPRMVPFLPEMEKALKEYIKGLTTTYLFPKRLNQYDPPIDEPCSSNTYLKDFNKRLERLGIKRPLTPYNFRHTAITRWLNDSKLNLFEVKRLVGHKNTETTEQYYAFGGYDKLIALMKTDPLVHKSLSQEEQFTFIKDAIKEVEVNKEYFEKEVEDTPDEIILRIKKKPPSK